MNPIKRVTSKLVNTYSTNPLKLITTKVNRETQSNNTTESMESHEESIEHNPSLDMSAAEAGMAEQARRKSTWAFWSHEDKDKVDEGSANHATTTVDDYPQTKDSLQKERASSWSFWSARTKTEDLQDQQDQINAVLKGDGSQNYKLPDVIKSDVTTSNELNNKGEPSEPQIGTTLNNITPNVEEALPLYCADTMFRNGFKYVKSILGYKETNEMHLYRRLESKRFKRVLIIGIHGFFPTKMIRSIIGHPTGTSMRFAQVAEDTVLEWAKENNMDIEIQKIALERDGKIFDRVQFFFEILKKSADDIKKADFIFVCAHSQGTPVSIILVSKLLEYGIIDQNKTIGILGMAGINMGPFYGMDKSLVLRAYSTIENASLLELFQFQVFESLQQRKYIESLRNLICHDVKITFVGSIDDQLVPLYSSIASHVQHPNIFKAVYIDEGTNTPAFVTRIIKLSCILQNIGYSDHGVIKEMSHALAGPITGGGHSKIYNDRKVYKTALNFTLKTESSSVAISQAMKLLPFDIKRLGIAANPYNLPWCTRGLFFEVMRTISSGRTEIDQVFSEFEDWNPESKILKDVKYRLNGIRAKL